MKKLGKLSINTEKIIKTEELVNLRGGYDGYGGDNCDASNCTGSCKITVVKSGMNFVYDGTCTPVPGTSRCVCVQN